MTALTAAAARFIPSADQASPFGDRLEKAKLLCYPGTPDDVLGGVPKELTFFLNPSSIQIRKSVQHQRDTGTQVTTRLRYGHTEPTQLTLGETWFDTYEARQSVREAYIDELEALADYDPETHHPRAIVFVFGEFSQRTRHKNVYVFLLSSLTVDYTMFLPDGTPVRAKVSLCLEQMLPSELEERHAPKESPDHAKLYTVQRGDTLAGIAAHAYGDAREWRRIADTNHIDDPMTLRPGRKLLLPPILK